MRSLALLLLGGLCLACAEQHGGRGRSSSNADVADAGDREEPEPTQEPPSKPDHVDVYDALDDFLAAIREYTKATCTCVEESGEETHGECIQSQSMVIGWRECARRGLDELDPEKVRRQLGCQAEEFYQRTECINQSSCSAGTERAFVDCQVDKLGCPTLDDALVIALSQACTSAMTGEMVERE